MPDGSSQGPVQQGHGQMHPFDTSSEFNKHNFVITQRLAQLHTNKVVKVVKVYDSDGNEVEKDKTGVVGLTGFVDVQIMANQVDGQGNAVPHGVIHNVPFARVQGGGNGVIMDPQVGDLGIMACSDRDISSVKKNRDVSNPGSYRKMDAADGMYVGGMLNGKPEQYVQFNGNGMVVLDKNKNKMTLDPDGWKIEDKNGNAAWVKNNVLTIKSKNITLDGDVTVTGGLVGNTGTAGAHVDLLHHVHPQTSDGHGDSEQNTGSPVGTALAASGSIVVKIE